MNTHVQHPVKTHIQNNIETHIRSHIETNIQKHIEMHSNYVELHQNHLKSSLHVSFLSSRTAHPVAAQGELVVLSTACK